MGWPVGEAGYASAFPIRLKNSLTCRKGVADARFSYLLKKFGLLILLDRFIINIHIKLKRREHFNESK